MRSATVNTQSNGNCIKWSGYSGTNEFDPANYLSHTLLGNTQVAVQGHSVHWQQEEIMRQSNDYSIYIWNSHGTSTVYGVLATEPAVFGPLPLLFSYNSTALHFAALSCRNDYAPLHLLTITASWA
jgi:hypothetical protein